MEFVRYRIERTPARPEVGIQINLRRGDVSLFWSFRGEASPEYAFEIMSYDNEDSDDAEPGRTTTPDDDVDVDGILDVLEENDGNPTALTDHRTIPYVLAGWRYSDDVAEKINFQKVSDEISWRSVGMSKSFFEEILEDIHADQKDNEAETAEEDIAAMTPEEVRDAFDWEHTQDRVIAEKCHQWCKENADLIFTNDQVMVLDGDIWERSEAMVAKILRRLVGEYYGRNIKEEFIEGYVSIDDEYHVEWQDVGIRGPRCVVENGILNLVDGEIEREARPDDYAVMKFPVRWKGMDAERDRWVNDFLNRSVAPRDIKKLQEFTGYCLRTNEYPFKKALMMVGGGNNGKGVYEQVLCGLLGTNHTMHDDLKDLSDNQFGAQRLRHNAANINSDIDGNEISNTSIFKKLTGRDPIRVEPKFQQAYSIQNPAKLLFAANSVPSVDDATLAFYARWCFIHFPNKFTTRDDQYMDANPDIHKDIVANELAGVLAWAVEGYQRLHQQEHFTGEADPGEVRSRWHEYADTTATFVRNYVEVGNTPNPKDTQIDHKFRVDQMYDYYEHFIASTPTAPETKQTLSAYIKNRFEDAETVTSRKAVRDDENKDAVRVWDGVHIPQSGREEIDERYKESL